MSVNIHKVLGYALTGITWAADPQRPGRQRISDPRINTESPLLFWTDLEETDEDFSIPDATGYTSWLEARQGPGDRLEARIIKNSLEKQLLSSPLTQTVVHDAESRFADTLVLIPPAMLHRWYRAGDSIDWWEDSLRPAEERQVSRLDFLPTGPSPYSDRFMDSDGTELNEEAAQLMWLAGEGMPEEELDEIANRIRPAARTKDRPMYRSGADALGRLVPHVPSSVRNLAEFGQIFTSPDVWKQLRPVMYTYWS